MGSRSEPHIKRVSFKTQCISLGEVELEVISHMITTLKKIDDRKYNIGCEAQVVYTSFLHHLALTVTTHGDLDTIGRKAHDTQILGPRLRVPTF